MFMSATSRMIAEPKTAPRARGVLNLASNRTRPDPARTAAIPQTRRLKRAGTRIDWKIGTYSRSQRPGIGILCEPTR